MKKLLGIMMVGLFSICLTGCGSKGNQLKCTGKVEGQDMTMTAEAKGKNVTIKATMDITKMSSDDIEEEFGASDLTKEKLESYAKEQGLTCK